MAGNISCGIGYGGCTSKAMVVLEIPFGSKSNSGKNPHYNSETDLNFSDRRESNSGAAASVSLQIGSGDMQFGRPEFRPKVVELDLDVDKDHGLSVADTKVLGKSVNDEGISFSDGVIWLGLGVVGAGALITEAIKFDKKAQAAHDDYASHIACVENLPKDKIVKNSACTDSLGNVIP